MQCLYIAHAEDECYHQGSLLEQRTLQQFAITALRVEEHPYEGDEEQRIASLGDRYAVWIGIDSEHASLAVFIVR